VAGRRCGLAQFPDGQHNGGGLGCRPLPPRRLAETQAGAPDAVQRGSHRGSIGERRARRQPQSAGLTMTTLSVKMFFIVLAAGVVAALFAGASRKGTVGPKL